MLPCGLEKQHQTSAIGSSQMQNSSIDIFDWWGCFHYTNGRGVWDCNRYQSSARKASSGGTRGIHTWTSRGLSEQGAFPEQPGWVCGGGQRPLLLLSF